MQAHWDYATATTMTEANMTRTVDFVQVFNHVDPLVALGATAVVAAWGLIVAALMYAIQD
jgi:hypothetical protein